MGKRRSRRVQVNLNTKIFLAGKTYEGQITNLSRDGIACSLTSVLNAPKDFIPITLPELYFELPTQETVTLRCELAWFSGTAPDEQKLTLGLRIIDPPEAYLEFMKGLYADDRHGPPDEAEAISAEHSRHASGCEPPDPGASEAAVNVYRSVIEAAGDSIYIVDTECRYQFMNQEHMSRVFLSSDDYIGRHYTDFHSGEESEEFTAKVKEVVSTGKSLTYEHRGPRECKYFLRTLSPLKGPRGNIIAIAVVSKNITDRRLAEELLIKSNFELENLVMERTASLSELNENLQQEVRGHRQTEDALKKASDEWRITFDSTRDMMMLLDQDFRVVKANRATCMHFDKPYSALIGQTFSGLFDDMDLPSGIHPLEAIRETKKHNQAEIYLKNSAIWVFISADPILDSRGEISGAVTIVRNITDQKNLQLQLLQSQKMESIGRLAGGVAHDFNNILSSIIGYAELALMKLPPENPVCTYLKTVKDSGEKAANLTQRLLAFSRKQVLQMQTVNLNKTIENMATMMQRIIREDILLELHMDKDLLPVQADPLQLEQIVMNLIINARDAMPGGGTLILETSNVTLGGDFILRHEEVKPGEYVLLSVSDTGVGMSKQVQSKIFEPFFTTKAVGEGTGLGLSTVYGIISQHNGYIHVYSEIDRGTTFKIYIPVSVREAKTPKPQKPAATPEKGALLLVVDDDPSIRGLIRESLLPLGYRILFAQDGEEALKLAEESEEPISLLLTDVIMPGMNGNQLAEKFRSLNPRAKIMFMSGYTNEAIAQQGVLGFQDILIQKPLSPSRLAAALSSALGNSR